MRRIIINVILLTSLLSANASAVQIEDSLAWAKDIYTSTIAVGSQIIKNHDDTAAVTNLLKSVPTIPIDDKHLMQCIEPKKAVQFADCFYMLRSMKMGASFDDAKDGLSFTTAYPTKIPNDNDYYKLMSIFMSKNELLKGLYLTKVPEVMQSYGLTEGLERIKPIIENNFNDSDTKKAVLDAYTRYSALKRGTDAPLSVLSRADGTKGDFSLYRGKVVVVDIWATWCCSCLEKLPHFKALAERYKGNDKVAFICLSIDRQKNWNTMRKKIDELGLGSLENWVADVEGGSSFEGDYCIQGIPRYLLIDKTGKVISAFAPSADEGLEEMIEKAIRLDSHVLNDEGIQFLDIPFKEALAKAQAEGKKVFVDCYIQSCGPCKRMAKEIFPLKDCGDYFNANFINIVRDCEKGDGVDVQKDYNVGIYPTFLVINPDGTLYCKELGAVTKRSKETFVQKMQKAMEVGAMEEEFWKGKRDAAFVGELIPLSYEHNSERVDLIMCEYMKDFSVKQMCQADNWTLISKFTRPSHQLFKRISADAKAFEKILGKEKVTTFLSKQ